MEDNHQESEKKLSLIEVALSMRRCPRYSIIEKSKARLFSGKSNNFFVFWASIYSNFCSDNRWHCASGDLACRQPKEPINNGDDGNKDN